MVSHRERERERERETLWYEYLVRSTKYAFSECEKKLKCRDILINYILILCCKNIYTISLYLPFYFW